MEDSLRSRGRLVIGVNASSLFGHQEHTTSASLRESFRGLNARIRDIHVSSFTLRHSFQVIRQKSPVVHGATSHRVQRVIDDKTRVVLTTRAVSGRAGASNLLGTVKHQYSPRLNFEVCIRASNWSGRI
jgi:DnaJ family protein C protein 11